MNLEKKRDNFVDNISIWEQPGLEPGPALVEKLYKSIVYISINLAIRASLLDYYIRNETNFQK